jgi:hypothetical protein
VIVTAGPEGTRRRARPLDWREVGAGAIVVIAIAPFFLGVLAVLDTMNVLLELPGVLTDESTPHAWLIPAMAFASFACGFAVLAAVLTLRPRLAALATVVFDVVWCISNWLAVGWFVADTVLWITLLGPTLLTGASLVAALLARGTVARGVQLLGRPLIVAAALAGMTGGEAATTFLRRDLVPSYFTHERLVVYTVLAATATVAVIVLAAIRARRAVVESVVGALVVVFAIAAIPVVIEGVRGAAWSGRPELNLWLSPVLIAALSLTYLGVARASARRDAARDDAARSVGYS